MGRGVDDMVDAVRRLLRHGVRMTRTFGSGVLNMLHRVWEDGRGIYGHGGGGM